MSAAEVGYIILDIVVFIIGLCALVCAHEAGHLAVAKICNVYCYEYSIGFGPAIFKHTPRRKRKDENVDEEHKPLYQALTKSINKDEGETQFSLRCIPLGGYVAMAGEDADSDDDYDLLQVPKERTLTGVNHFKQICIMLAGIAVNFLLGYLLLVVSFSCEQAYYDYTSNEVIVAEEDNPLYDAGLRDGDLITSCYQKYENLYYYVDEEATELTQITEPVYYPSSTATAIESYYALNDEGDALSETCLNYALSNITNSSNGIEIEGYGQVYIGEGSTRTIYLTYNRDDTEYTLDPVVLTTSYDEEEEAYSLQTISISASIVYYYMSTTEAFQEAGSYFGYYFVNIYQALGKLFTPSGWQNVGGLVAVYEVSAAAIDSGAAAVFNIWAYISINLGCFNLIPFPALDGWQVLLALVESISRKKVPNKFKNIASTVGMVLIFILAIVLIVKDIIF